MKINKTIFTTSILLINTTLDNFVFEIGIKQVFIIHFFIFSIWIFTNFIENRIEKNNKQNFTNILLINFSRIILSVLFLFIPSIFFEVYLEKNYIINFFTIYFLYLFLEIKTKKNREKK